MIYDSDDAGATWRRVDSPTDAALTSVAIAGGGTAVAGSSAGEILVGTAGDWTVAGTAAGPVRAVAASPDPVWGDGQPDLVAATGADVLGSDDALAFATLPGLPAPGAQPWSAVAWSGVPARSLLIAGVSAGRLLPDRGPELGRRRFGPLRRRARRHAGRPERRLSPRRRRAARAHAQRRPRARDGDAGQEPHHRRRQHAPHGDRQRRRARHGAGAHARPRRAWRRCRACRGRPPTGAVSSRSHSTRR